MNQLDKLAEDNFTERISTAIIASKDDGLPSFKAALLLLTTFVTMLRTISDTLQTADVLQDVAQKLRANNASTMPF